MYSLGLESLAPNTSVGNNHGKNTCLIDHKIFTFFTFMLVTKTLMHNDIYNVENHHYHKNYLNLDYSLFPHLNLFYVNVICKN